MRVPIKNSCIIITLVTSDQTIFDQHRSTASFKTNLTFLQRSLGHVVRDALDQLDDDDFSEGLFGEQGRYDHESRQTIIVRLRLETLDDEFEQDADFLVGDVIDGFQSADKRRRVT